MSIKIKILLVFIICVFLPIAVSARSGCCSHHGGVCGCGCCDGTGLSATCAPYYPECNRSSEPEIEQIEIPVIHTPSPVQEVTPIEVKEIPVSNHNTEAPILNPVSGVLSEKISESVSSNTEPADAEVLNTDSTNTVLIATTSEQGTSTAVLPVQTPKPEESLPQNQENKDSSNAAGVMISGLMGLFIGYVIGKGKKPKNTVN